MGRISKEKLLAKYFSEGFESFFESRGEEFTGKFKVTSDESRLLRFREIFNADDLKRTHYERVIGGQGNEKEKIDAVYSSSLQSYVFFNRVDKDHPITIPFEDGPMTFTKVLFEFKNKVIKYPSSIDVVLVNEETRSICFIESKLFEIVRDSNEDGNKVIGISYFKAKSQDIKHHNIGYQETLHLELSDLDKMGIKHPGCFLEKVNGNDSEKCSIIPIGRNKYVYSEGIKQVLSHMIGILNFKKEMLEDTDLKPYNFDHYYYLELYNELPHLENKIIDAREKINNFVEHFKEVQKILEDKINHEVKIAIMSYQELFADESNQQVVNETILKYYKVK